MLLPDGTFGVRRQSIRRSFSTTPYHLRHAAQVRNPARISLR
jgi:hypothetical protein